MNIFGVTKIDKLKLGYAKDCVMDTKDREKIYDRVKRYFKDSTDHNKYGTIYHRITPTKLSQGNDEISNNLQMPSEEVLLQALSEITLDNSSLQEHIRTTEIHLAKDVILNFPVPQYLYSLANLEYGKLHIETIEGEKGICGLRFKYKHKIGSENNVKFLIKFYDKSEECEEHQGCSICKLDEPLSDEDKKKVGDAYCSDTNTLDLAELNVLRVEIEFHTSSKILPITNALGDIDDRFLRADILIKSLEEGRLYQIIEDIFSKTLEKLIFNKKEKLENLTADVSIIRKLACDAMLGNSDYCRYKAVMREAGLESRFSEIRRICEKAILDSELYSELCNKLIFSKINDKAETEKETVLEKEFACSCNCKHSSKPIKDYLLAYQVFIWDDS